MPGAAPRGKASRVTRPAAIAAGNSHLRHEAALAWPGGPGEDGRIWVLLPGPWHAGADLAGLTAGPTYPGGPAMIIGTGCTRARASQRAWTGRPGSRRGSVPATRRERRGGQAG